MGDCGCGARHCPLPQIFEPEKGQQTMRQEKEEPDFLHEDTKHCISEKVPKIIFIRFSCTNNSGLLLKTKFKSIEILENKLLVFIISFLNT